MNRLIRQDRLIASNTIRATFAGRHDRAIAALMLLAALTFVHAWFADRPGWLRHGPLSLPAG